MQVIDSDFISFGDAWISITFVLVIILGGLQGAYFAKTDRKLAAMVESEIAGGATELSPSTRRKRSARAAWARLTGLLVLAAVFVMVFKPGA